MRWHRRRWQGGRQIRNFHYLNHVLLQIGQQGTEGIDPAASALRALERDESICDSEDDMEMREEHLTNGHEGSESEEV